MRLFKALFLCIVISTLTGHLCAQGGSAQIKVRESRLFGLKGERFAEFELSSQGHSRPLSCDSVNAGPYYYFALRPVGDWKLDVDFVQEDLSKLVILQDSATIQIGWKTDILTDSLGTCIILGYPKNLKLHQPFSIQFNLDGVNSQAELKIPQEYWPGFSKLMAALKQAQEASLEKRYRDAITLYEHLSKADSLRIFPQFKEFPALRTECFQNIVDESWSVFVESTRTPATPLKEKISGIDKMTPQMQFVIDSLANPSLIISAADSSVKPLIDHAKEILMRVKGTRDSLQRALDDLNVRWISEGAATGKNGPQYVRMIEILAYAFSSLNFADTTARPLALSLPTQYQAALAKDNLQESYTIFIRQASERFQKRLPMFPPGFLVNLQKDSSSFPLPCYPMLKAVQDYYSGSFADALDAIHSVFRTCFEPELSRRFDEMRVLIDFRLRGPRPTVSSLMDEASTAEKAGDKDLAIDRYSTVLRLAPEVAYAAYLCGTLYLRAGDPIRARSFFERAFETDSLYLSAYREAWTLYKNSGNYKAMIDVLTRAIRCGNDYWETNINLGIAYLGDGDLIQAIKQFERALAINPNNYQTNVQLGLAYQTAKDFQKAREYFNKAIFIDPHRMEAVEFLQKLDELQKVEH